MKSVIHINGLVLAIMSLVMLVPIAIDFSHAKPFISSSAITAYCAATMFFATNKLEHNLGVREAFLLTSFTWVLVSAFSSLPFLFYGHTLADSVFETVSGLTTTGSTVLSGLDTTPHALLFWRSWLQWIGGIGMIVTSIAVLPFLKIGGMQLFQTESSDRSEKELPRAASVAAATLWVYATLTALCVAAYFWAGMSFFDAISHALTTLSTGGYSTHDASMGYFKSHTILWIATVFMALGGIPFVMYIQLLRRHGRKPRTSQFRFFICFLLISTSILSLWLIAGHKLPPLDAITYVAFNVVSVVTTTGFGSVDYTSWGPFPAEAFFLLTFVGGCAGSTAGGIKVMRVIVAIKLIKSQILKIIWPNRVVVTFYEGKPLTNEIIASVCSFIFIYIAGVIITAFLLQVIGLDFTTAISGSVTAFSNVGPGLGDIIGPSGNFASLPDSAKWILSFAMLLGRLEFMAILVLLLPAFWRRF